MTERPRSVAALLMGMSALAATEPVRQLRPADLKAPTRKRQRKYQHPGKNPLGTQNFARPTPTYTQKTPSTAADAAALQKAALKQRRKAQARLARTIPILEAPDARE